MTLARRISMATDGFRGGGFAQQSISSLFAGDVEIITMVTAEVITEISAEVVSVITAEVVNVISAEICS